MFGPVRFSVAKSGARFANLNFGAVAKIPAGVSRLAYSTGTSTTSSSSTVVKAQDKTKSAKTDKVENVEKGEFNFKPSEVSSLKNSAGTTVKEDWSEDYHGVSTQSFDQRVIDILMAPLENQDVEIKPDGLLYLPEIKYRRVLNRAFGPGGWGLIPRGPYSTNDRVLSREYALLCHGRFISQARGEQDYFEESGIPTATEGVKSNALMRCCKDLGIASELWDPGFIQKFKSEHCVAEWVTHVTKGQKKLVWRRKDRSFEYPWVKK